MSAAADPSELTQLRARALALDSARDPSLAVFEWSRVVDAAPEDFQANERLAHHLCVLGRQAEAIPYLRAVTRADPQGPKGWMRLARSLAQTGDVAAAVAAWDEVLALYPTSEEACLSPVRLLIGEGDLPAAGARVLSIAPDSGAWVPGWTELARALQAKGETEGAIDAWSRLLGSAAGNEPHQALAELFQSSGRPEAAIPHLRILLDLTPDWSKGWTRLARSLTDAGDPGGAIAAWRRVLSLQPDNEEAPLALVRLLIAQGDLPAAGTCLRSTPRESAGWVSGWIELARALQAKGETEGAIDAWSRLLGSAAGNEPHQALAELFQFSGRPEAAVPHLRILLDLTPDWSKGWTRLARSLAEAGDLGGAIAAWRRALSLQPHNVEASLALVRLLIEQGDLPAAEACVRSTPGESASWVSAWTELARALQSAGETNRAIEAWGRVVGATTQAEPRQVLVELLLSAGLTVEAIPHLRVLLSLAPDWFKGWTRLGRSLTDAGDIPAAVLAWERVLSLDPENEEASLSLVRLSISRRDHSGGAARLRALPTGSPARVAGWTELARSLQAAGDAEGAIEAWRQLVGAAGSDEPHHALAELLQAAGRPAEAVPHLRALLDLAPDWSKGWTRLARSLTEAGDESAAMEAWRKVVELDPGTAVAHEALFRLLRDAGRPAEASGHLQTLAEMAQDQVAGWSRLARYREHVGDSAGAVDAWRRVLEQHEEGVEAHQHLGLLLQRLDQSRPALVHLRRVVDLSPRWAAARIRLGRSLTELGEVDEAIEVWRKAVAVQETYEGREQLIALLLRSGRIEEAVVDLEAMAAHAVSQPAVRKRLIGCLRVAGAAHRPSADDEAPAWTASSELARIQDLLELARIFGKPLGDSAVVLVEALVTVLAERMAEFIGAAQIVDPSAVAERWTLISGVYGDPRFAAFSIAAPEQFADLLRRIATGGPDMSPLIDDAIALWFAAPPESAGRTLSRALVAGGPRQLPIAEGRLERIVAGAEFAAPVLICGFHHSGTRLAADVMRRLGVFQRTNTPSQEWSYIQVLNTLLCPHWMDVGGIERFADGWDRSLIDPDRLAWRLAAAGFRGDGCWGHKDPRTCVTAEAWLDAFPGLRILNIVRDPRDVLGTLPERYARFSPGGARPQEDMPFWAGLWSAYLQRTRAAMRMAGASCEVRFEDLCADPVGTARRIRSELGLPRALDARRLRELAINPGKVGEHRNWLAQGTLTARQVSWLDRLAGDEGYERAST